MAIKIRYVGNDRRRDVIEEIFSVQLQNGEEIERTDTPLEALHLKEQRHPNSEIINVREGEKLTDLPECPLKESFGAVSSYSTKQGEWEIMQCLTDWADEQFTVERWQFTDGSLNPSPPDVKLELEGDSPPIGLELTSLVDSEQLEDDIHSEPDIATSSLGVDSLTFLRQALEKKRGKISNYRCHFDEVWLLIHPIPPIEIGSSRDDSSVISREYGRSLHIGDARRDTTGSYFDRIYFLNTTRECLQLIAR